MRSNPPWLELIQIVPVMVVAAPIVFRGEVDLAALPVPFVVAAALAVVANSVVLWRGAAINPIAFGTDVWLLLGAVAFGVGVPTLPTVLADTQGFALFVVISAVSAAFLGVPTGVIGARGDDRQIQRSSIGLLLLIFAATLWSWWFQHDVRLGGGLPFIVCNVVRRVVIARFGARAATQAPAPGDPSG